MNDHNRRSDIAEDIFTYKAAKTDTGTEEVFLKMKCPHCGTLNLIPVHRIIYPQKTPEHAISEPATLYEPTKTTKCEKLRLKSIEITKRLHEEVLEHG